MPRFKAYYGVMTTARKPLQRTDKPAFIEHRAALQESILAAASDLQQKQRRRMLVAAILLLVALGIILTRDRNLWLGEDQIGSAEVETAETATRVPPQGTKTHSPVGSERSVKKQSDMPQPAPPVNGPSSVVTDRKALPPLEVEVVAGGMHRALQTGNGSIKVGIGEGAEPVFSPILEAAELATPPAVHASQRVKMSADTAQALAKPVDPSYPVLARQMKVQGAVAIQALIGADGAIQDLHVLSGPSILASAAQEAVRKWRFKPYLQNGEPVETQARITVNFTISTF